MRDAGLELDEHLTVLTQKAGFSLTEAERREYAEAYRPVAAMALMLDRSVSYMDEPAHVYGYNVGGDDA